MHKDQGKGGAEDSADGDFPCLKALAAGGGHVAGEVGLAAAGVGGGAELVAPGVEEGGGFHGEK